MFRYIHLIFHGAPDLDSFDSLLSDPSSDYIVNGCTAGSITFNNKEVSTGCGCNCEKQDATAAKNLYLLFKDLFKKNFISTQKSSFVQFLYFYMISIRPMLLADFLDYLRSTFECFSNSRDQKKNVISYLSSLLSRGNFVSYSHIFSCTQLLSDWCLKYMERHVSCDPLQTLNFNFIISILEK